MSAVGLAKIAEAEPALTSRLVRADFLEYACGKFSYVVAMQSFQHGNDLRSRMYFRHATRMLRLGGLLFLRVNASGTDVRRAHYVLEESAAGFTALHREGPLCALFLAGRACFAHLPKRHARGAGARLGVVRPAGGGGSWSQWELTARRL